MVYHLDRADYLALTVRKRCRANLNEFIFAVVAGKSLYFLARFALQQRALVTGRIARTIPAVDRLVAVHRLRLVETLTEALPRGIVDRRDPEILVHDEHGIGETVNQQAVRLQHTVELLS